ncbi:hypothetical protein BT93_F1226 [Corymbia citriodora subsp. variegata]|nr:hypothetical protein BT93_F1226 [Corymbia citriodora subsp. variegata]
MLNIALSVASKVAGYLVAPVGRQCGYVIFANSYVGQLKVELEKLDDVKVGVQRSVDDAENNMREIKREVNRWKNNAETVANKACSVLDNFAKSTDGRAKKTCSCGWLPNPKERYCLGRDARKTIQAIQALVPQGKFERVYYESAPPGRVVGLSNVNLPAGAGDDTIPDSRASIIQGIMKALDDEKLKVIGVYGPGGVGKTTLLEEVEKKLKKEGRPFHMIVKAKVSQQPVLKNIQDEIADALKLDLKDVLSEGGRGERLLERLQRDPSEKVLIILDDLWDKLDLKAVGIPWGEESRGCKLLLSSRFKDVLEQKMLADRTFRLEGLSNDEAFKLFEKMVGDRLKDEELKRIAAKVVKKLAGLPLLITSVASTLRYSGVSAWKNALIKIDESNIETIVKLSYDHLKSEDAKSLFLLCGLLGGTIQVETLLGLGMGLGLFDGYNRTMQDSRDRLNTMLESLHSICLLQDWGNDKDNVIIHDLYSEVVVSTPFRSQHSLMINSNYGSWSEEKLKKCWAICLADVGRDRLTKLMLCQYPDLKILMLSHPEDWPWMLAHEHDVRDCWGLLDFTHMKELQVLYLWPVRITTLLSSIGILEKLRSLYLDNCLVEDMAIIGKLKVLQILSFAKSKISKLPKEIGELTNLRSLNLSNCYLLAIIEPGVFKGLINLEELYMRRTFDRWMGEDEILSELCNAKLAELKSLTKLTSLEMSISDPTILSEDGDLPFGNLMRFWISIGNGQLFEGSRNMRLNLEGCDNILSEEWVQKTLSKTEHLELIGLRESKKNADELCIQGFPKLKDLYMRDCPSIKYIASSSNGAFTILESLFLDFLINLEKICRGPVTRECFSKLKVVIVSACDQLKNLWCLSEIQRLVQLEVVEICLCPSMQAIVIHDAREDKVAPNDMVELPNPRRLKLDSLPNMTSYYSGSEIISEGALIQVCLPSLEELVLRSVGPFKRIWHGKLPSSSFCKLASVSLNEVSDLLNVFPKTIIGRLHNLESVFVDNCPSLESLFDFGSLDSNTEQTIELLPKLKSVMVQGCPSLESLFICASLDSSTEQKFALLPRLDFMLVKEAGRLRHIVKSDSQTVLGFPNLSNVYIENCSDLRYLFPNVTATQLEKLKELIIIDCKQMKEVVPKEESGRSKGKAMSFSSLTRLSILQCPNIGAFIRSPTSVQKGLGGTAEKNESPQPFFNEMVTFPNIKMLEITGVQCKELWNNQIPNDSFCKLEYLEMRDCDNLQRVAPCQMWKRLQHCLEILKVMSSRSIKIIYEGDGTDTKSGALRRLVLRDLDNLRHIWQSDGLPIVPFPNLKYLEAVRCSRLEMLFATFTEKFLKQIEELVVESCKEMELIAGHEEHEEATGMTITFSKLTALGLFKLPKFRSFLPEKYSMKFPSLQVLSIVSCGIEPDQGVGDWKLHQLRRESEIDRETWNYKSA